MTEQQAEKLLQIETAKLLALQRIAGIAQAFADKKGLQGAGNNYTQDATNALGAAQRLLAAIKAASTP